MDAKTRLQLIAATSIMVLVLAAFIISFFDRTYSPPVALIGLGSAVVTWLFGSAVREEVLGKRNNKKNGQDSDESE